MRQRLKRDEGNALLMTLFLIFVMAALVTAQFSVVQKNTRQSTFFGNYENLRQYADSGAYIALSELSLGNDGLIGTTLWTTADDVGADGQAGTSDTGEGDGIPTPGEPNLFPSSIGPTALGMNLLVYVADTGYANTKRVVATAYTTEAEAVVETYAKQSITSVPKVGAVYMDPNVVLDVSGNSFSISGIDTNPDGTPGPGPDTFGIATSVGDPPGSNSANFVSQVPASRQDQITGIGGTPSIGEEATVVDVEGLFESFKASADQSVAPGDYSNVTWGSAGSPMVTYVNGDLTLDGTGSGYGILLVDGNLAMDGQFEFDGLVIVRGDMSQSGGGLGTHIYGSLWVTGYLTLVDDNELSMSGTADITYSSQMLDVVNSTLGSSGGTYTVLYWNQLK